MYTYVYCWLTHCLLESLDTVSQWLRQPSLVTAVYSLRTGLFGYSSIVVASGWFAYCCVFIAYWIIWMQFHSGYVRLVWLLLCIYCVLDYLDTVS